VHTRTAVGASLALAVVLRALPAKADACTPPSGLSRCFDAQNLWLGAAPSRLVGLDTLEPQHAGGWSGALGVGYVDRPVRLLAPSPDPDGRDVPVVTRGAIFDLVLGAVLTDELSAEAALGLAWYAGGGVDAAVSQRSEAADWVVLRDPRFRAGYRLGTLELGRSTRAISALRYDLTLPLGGAFAGARSIVSAPGYGLALHHARLVLVGDVALRSKRAVEFAGTRLGSELFVGLGAAYSVWPERITLGLEIWLWPSLLESRRTLPDGAVIEQGAQLPAEWSLSTKLQLTGALSIQIGFGTGLPLSSQRRIAEGGAEQIDDFAAVTTPRWRSQLVLRLAPGPP
jgi:hypothetical protein